MEHAKEQHHKALKELQQSEEAAWAEGAQRLAELREEQQAAARKAERQAGMRLEEATRRLQDLQQELAQCESQRARLAQAQVIFRKSAECLPGCCSAVGSLLGHRIDI